ncbi:MAG: ABC transporter ATP-binding protein [Ignavibacteriales bacterium]|nr:ABC transporter ATP-binding protein [Ignavibacteriales bacterium]
MIQVEHLTKRYGKFTAVNDISFEVKSGEVFAFLGPNGSGKTTTMKSIIGLNVPTSGRVLVNGLDVQTNPKDARRFLSYLPQRVVFPENLTAREIIHFYARMRKLPKGLADEALARARFNGFSDKLVSEFSGGMTQRLGLAVASLPDAPILLLDEPTANLDPQGVKRFREFILEQKERKKTIIFSTHLLAEAEQLADRVGIFVTSKLVAIESIENLRSMYLANKTIEDMYLHYVGEYHHEE